MSITLVGGVGYRWHGDGSFGVLATDALAHVALPSSVMVADLGYGAIYAAQDIAQSGATRVILVAAVERGDPPGTVRRYRYDKELPSPDEILARVREAGAGVIDLDHLLIIAQQMNLLPSDVLVIEVEPADVGTGTELSPMMQSRLRDVIGMIRAEVEPQPVEQT